VLRSCDSESKRRTLNKSAVSTVVPLACVAVEQLVGDSIVLSPDLNFLVDILQYLMFVHIYN